METDIRWTVYLLNKVLVYSDCLTDIGLLGQTIVPIFPDIFFSDTQNINTTNLTFVTCSYLITHSR